MPFVKSLEHVRTFQNKLNFSLPDTMLNPLYVLTSLELFTACEEDIIVLL